VSSGAAPAADAEDGAALLAARPLLIPVAGIAPSALVDTYEQPRPGGRHEAIDIVAPRGTPVHAVDDGKLVKLFTSVPGGLTVYQFDPEGRLTYYYAHLDRYADGLKEGMMLRRGDLVGYVGVTGNAGQTPHLHFAVFRLGPERQWWKGDPVNPYPALRRARAVG
jgi:peptidoglycan LD-endopeptidase LytH